MTPSSAKTAWRTPPSSGAGSHHSSQNDRPPSSSSSSKSRGRSKHSQRILAARFSGQQSDTDTTIKLRPPSGHRTRDATHSHLESTEYNSTVRQKAMMVSHDPNRSVTEKTPRSTSVDSRSQEGIGATSLLSSTTSGISSLRAGIDESVSFISTGPKTGYNRHYGGQPDSLPKVDRLTPHTSSNVLGTTKEPSLTHQRPLFDKNKATVAGVYGRYSCTVLHVVYISVQWI